MRFHDLRHFAGTIAATSGASLKEIKARMGQASNDAAIRYLKAAESRDREIATSTDDSRWRPRARPTCTYLGSTDTPHDRVSAPIFTCVESRSSNPMRRGHLIWFRVGTGRVKAAMGWTDDHEFDESVRTLNALAGPAWGPDAPPVLLGPWQHLQPMVDAAELAREEQRKQLESDYNAETNAEDDYAGRYPIELLQNAQDAAASSGLVESTVWIHVSDTALLVANKGAPFTAPDVDALLHQSYGSKRAGGSRAATIGSRAWASRRCSRSPIPRRFAQGGCVRAQRIAR